MEPKKILALKLRALGDTVLLTAPLQELRRLYPEAEIHVAVFSPWSDLLIGLPSINRVWPVPKDFKSKSQKWWSYASMIRAFRKQKYDLVLNFHSSPTAARIAALSGARHRAIHFHGLSDKNQFSTFRVPGKGVLKPIIERDMDTIRSLGVHIPAGKLPKVHLHPSEIDSASQFLGQLEVDTRAKILAINLGASRPTKSWPLSRFAGLAVEWANETGPVLGLASSSESTLLREFLTEVDAQLTSSELSVLKKAEIRKRIKATCNLSIRELAAVLSCASVVVGNDSGPKHLAVALNKPTVTLFGPENPFEWHPYPRQRHPYFFVESLSCRKNGVLGAPPWCGIPQCVDEEHKCMTLIGVTEVLKECQRVLNVL